MAGDLQIGKRQDKYTIGLCKAASAIPEVQRLLEVWIPGEDKDHFFTRVRESGILGRQTAQRTRDLVFRVFSFRLLYSGDKSARWLKKLLEGHNDVKTFKELLFLYTARTDAFLYDFTIQHFWPAHEAGYLYIRPQDVQDFIREATNLGRIEHPWSAQTQIKLTRSLLGALNDFGFLHESKRGQREIVDLQPTDLTVAYVAYELHFAGVTDGSLPEHPDWQLFGLRRERVLNRLDALDERAQLILQRAGLVVRITWGHSTMEGLIHAYTAG